MIRSLAKRVGLAAVVSVPMPALTRRLLRQRGIIFMLHRFRDPEHGQDGHDPQELRRSLAYLREHGYELVSLEELFRCLAAASRSPSGAIALTIDDGYRDQATIGAPIFAEFDCPVTTFLTTGFLDRKMWFWWDRITYIFARTRAHKVRVRLADQLAEYNWSDGAQRQGARFDFETRCKGVSSAERECSIAQLAAEADVPLPAEAPAEYAPMSWDMVRGCERGGMTFGPHTVTHPILSQTDAQGSEHEIVESWRRLREETSAAVPVFCYPNGQPGDYGRREMKILERTGMLGAVLGSAGYASVEALGADSLARFEVPRFSWPDSHAELVQQVSGLERLKEVVLRRA